MLGAGICGGDIFWFALWAVQAAVYSGVWGLERLGLVLGPGDRRAVLSRQTWFMYRTLLS